MRLNVVLTLLAILLVGCSCGLINKDVIPVDEDLEDPLLDLLWDCNRLEISYHPDTFSYWFKGASSRRLLSDEEQQQIERLEKGIIRDPDRIMQFFDACSLMDYIDEGGAVIPYINYATVDCYQEERLLASFKYVRPNILIDSDGRFNAYPYDCLRSLDRTPELWPFLARQECAVRIRSLGVSVKTLDTWPAPNRWCDIVSQAFTRMDYTTSPAPLLRFQCPSPGLSHYALNVQCRPDSPPDMVLLFETEPGWNKHGGPELFTFNNHNPTGGLVLLKNQAVKFIRTKEDLMKLRWE